MRVHDRSLLRIAALAAALFLGSSRLPADPVPPVDSAALEAAAASAGKQVQRCYRAPRIGPSGRSIVTHIRVRYAPGGTLIGDPEIVGQDGVTPANRRYAERLAEAARLAVIRCTPVDLPDAFYAAGDSVDLTFAPRALG